MDVYIFDFIYRCASMSYSPKNKLAIGFMRFESLRPGFADSRFESKEMDSRIPKLTPKKPKICVTSFMDGP